MLGRRMQKYGSTHLHDHVPALLEMDVGINGAYQAQFTPPANRDAMMTAYSQGYRRQGFLEEFEEKTKMIPEDQWRATWDHGEVQTEWNLLSACIRDRMTEHLPKQENNIIDYKLLSEQRMQLIRERGELRQRRHLTGSKSFEGNGPIEFDRVEQQLKELS
eukprot:2419669-Pyramimonas_sp.AAC.1